MMRSLYSGVAGLKSHTTRMDVVGNNIANINTVGFKGSRTTFADMLSQTQSAASASTDTRGGINPKQIGLGVNVASIDLIFLDASPQSTGKNTDLALQGEALFYLKGGDQSYYTRNGAFLFDESGYYVMTGNGYRVQGWNASPEGVLNTNGTSTDIIVPVGKTMEATETTKIDYKGNLDKESKMIKSISYTTSTSADADELKVVTGRTRDTATGEVSGTTTSVNVDGENVIAATITFRDDTTLTVTSGYYEVGKSVPITTLATIYDSLGGRHEVTLLLDKDPDSTDTTLTDNDAISTAKYYYYTDADGNTLTKSSTGIYTDASGNEVKASDVITYTVTRENDTYTYTDANGTEQTLTAGDVTTVFDNRWRVYIAPGVGEQGPAASYDTNENGNDNADTTFSNSYTRSEATNNPESDGSSTLGEMNKISYLYFNDRGAFVNNGSEEDASVTFTYGDGNGAKSNQAVIDFSGLTQYANSTTSFPTTNGNTAGVLQSVAVDSSGIIIGTYTNGLVRNEAQIAVAQFTNTGGLTKVASTVYQESNNSGTANIKRVSDFGVSVISSALEMSNVELATEFSEMIITQRGFQANSKMTTVADEMLETLINMKR